MQNVTYKCVRYFVYIFNDEHFFYILYFCQHIFEFNLAVVIISIIIHYICIVII